MQMTKRDRKREKERERERCRSVATIFDSVFAPGDTNRDTGGGP